MIVCGLLGEKATTGSTGLSEGCFLFCWNCASREEMGDKIKIDFMFRTEPVRKKRDKECNLRV